MKKNVGVIELGEIAFLSDPCYGTMSMYNSTIQTIPGKYNVYVTISESNSRFYMGRITSIMAVHQDYYPKFKTMPKNDRESLFCAVDSGTCGIFDKDYFKKFHTEDDVDDEWYDKFVINMDSFINTENKGAISSSGWGDGCYPVYAEYVGDKAFAIRIKFL